MKAALSKLSNPVVVKSIIVIVILGIGFGIAYKTDKNRGLDINKSSGVKNTGYEKVEKQLEYQFTTPWPPTEPQKECNERLEDDRNNQKIGPSLPALYCGATGEYIAYGNGTPYIFNLDTITNPVSNISQSQQNETCVSHSIPFKTITTYESWLQQGQQQTFGGLNGTEISCTNSQGQKRIVATIRPYDKKIVIGTGEPFSYSIDTSSYESYYYSPPEPRYTQAEAQSLATSNCQALLGQYNAVASSAYSQCIRAYLTQYGY